MLLAELLVDGVEAGVDLAGGLEGGLGELDLLGDELVVGVVGTFHLDVEAGDEGGDAELLTAEAEETSAVCGRFRSVGYEHGEAWGVGGFDGDGWTISTNDEALDSGFLSDCGETERGDHRQR